MHDAQLRLTLLTGLLMECRKVIGRPSSDPNRARAVMVGRLLLCLLEELRDNLRQSTDSVRAKGIRDEILEAADRKFQEQCHSVLTTKHGTKCNITIADLRSKDENLRNLDPDVLEASFATAMELYSRAQVLLDERHA